MKFFGDDGEGDTERGGIKGCCEGDDADAHEGQEEASTWLERWLETFEWWHGWVLFRFRERVNVWGGGVWWRRLLVERRSRVTGFGGRRRHPVGCKERDEKGGRLGDGGECQYQIKTTQSLDRLEWSRAIVSYLKIIQDRDMRFSFQVASEIYMKSRVNNAGHES